MPASPRIPEPNITSKLLGSGSRSGGTAFGGTEFEAAVFGCMANPNPVVGSDTKPESKVEMSERTARRGSPGHAPLTLKSKPVPLEIPARLYGSATRKRCLGFHSFAVLPGKATEYRIESAMAGATSSRHTNVTCDRQANRVFICLLSIRGLGPPDRRPKNVTCPLRSGRAGEAVSKTADPHGSIVLHSVSVAC